MTLLAPGVPGSVLLGRGPAEVHALIPWERPELAAALAGAPADLAALVAGHDMALAFTRSADLAAALRAVLPRVLSHDPEPAAGHASCWLARPLSELGLAAADEPPPHTPTEAEARAAASFLDQLPARFLALHPGSGSPRKNWPAERFAALAGRVAPGRPFLLVEGPADAAAVRPLAATGRAVVAQGLPPRVLGALLSRAGAYVGNDSGVSHLAAAWGAPSLVLFGPTDPRTWSPLGPQVRTLRGDGGRLDALDLERVASEAMRLG